MGWIRRRDAESVDLATLEPERVLLIKPSSLGDVVHALPVLGALRARWSSARIAWVVSPGLRSLVEDHQALDEILLFERRRMRLSRDGLSSIAALATALRKGRFDLVVDLQGLLRSGLMSLATGARVRVGMASAREGSRRFYTHVVPEGEPRPHAIDRLLAVASVFGADISQPRFDVPVKATDREWARRALEGVRQPILTVNLGARWLTKRWAPQGFAEVARRAAEERGAGVVIVGASEDRPLADAFAAALGQAAPVVDLCGGTTLMQLAAVAERSSVFLSNDTGPLHLAAAVGAYTLGVYTCTRPEWTGPYGPRAASVVSRVSCAGSCVKQCAHLSCLTELTPDRVYRALADQLRRSLANPAAA